MEQRTKNTKGCGQKIVYAAKLWFMCDENGRVLSGFQGLEKMYCICALEKISFNEKKTNEKSQN